MDVKNAKRLAEVLGCTKFSADDLVDALTSYVRKYDDERIIGLLMKAGIGFIHFHYGL